MASNFDTNMSVWGQLANLQDLAKQYLFQVQFYFESSSPLAQILNREDLMIRARTASIPGKTFGELDTQYMGTKLLYPGKATVNGDLEIQWDEFQDGEVSIALHKWGNLLMNQGFRDDIGGSSNDITGGAFSNYAPEYCATVDLVLFKSTLRERLPVFWRMYRVWPKNIANFGMDQNADQRIDAFEQCCWRRLLRVPWTAR